MKFIIILTIFINTTYGDWVSKAVGSGIAQFTKEMTGSQTETDMWREKYQKLYKEYAHQCWLKQRESEKSYTKWRKAQKEIYKLKQEISKLRQAMKSCGCNEPREKKKLHIELIDKADNVRH